MEGIPEYKVGAADLPRRPLAVKFLYVAIVPANACQCTKFKLSSSISFGDMREVRSQNKKWQLLISPDKFLYRGLVRVNAYTSVPNCKFLAPLVTEIWRGSHNKKWALLISPDTP